MSQIKYFSWFGGKFRCIPYINAILPNDCTAWYELCCGSGAVTLNKHRHGLEVVNDLDPEIYNLFRLMAHTEKGKILLDRLLKLQYSKSEFIRAQRAKANGFKYVDEYRMAEMSYILISQSFNATRQSWRKGVSQYEYTRDLMYHLPAVYERLQGVKVLNMDCVEVLKRIKERSNACVLLDVPYRQELRGAKWVYTYEMPMKKQIELLETIRDSKNKIILCGYRTEDGEDLYDKYLLSCGWKHYMLCKLVKSCQFKDVKDVATEWVWVNYQLPEFSKYLISHKSAEL